MHALHRNEEKKVKLIEAKAGTLLLLVLPCWVNINRPGLIENPRSRGKQAAAFGQLWVAAICIVVAVIKMVRLIKHNQ